MFAKCSVEKVDYRGLLLANEPVNLNLCKFLRKTTYSHYPDNEGIPAIQFVGCDVQWKYLTVEERNKDFERIATNKGADTH